MYSVEKITNLLVPKIMLENVKYVMPNDNVAYEILFLWNYEQLWKLWNLFAICRTKWSSTVVFVFILKLAVQQFIESFFFSFFLRRAR